MEDLREIVEEVKRKVVTDKALETASMLASLLSILDEDSDDLCQVLMIMHRLVPKAPMPEAMVKMLQKHGHNPNVQVATEEDIARLAVEGDCDCLKCQELRAKHLAAKPNPLVTAGQNTVH